MWPWFAEIRGWLVASFFFPGKQMTRAGEAEETAEKAAVVEACGPARHLAEETDGGNVVQRKGVGHIRKMPQHVPEALGADGFKEGQQAHDSSKLLHRLQAWRICAAARACTPALA